MTSSKPTDNGSNDEKQATVAKPTVIGLYGLPGSGKTTLMKQLKNELSQLEFCFSDGSELIDSIVPGGLHVFQFLGNEEKQKWRKSAIQIFQEKCSSIGRIGVVTGHHMFWSETKEEPEEVTNSADLQVYTHIIYLKTPGEVIELFRAGDTKKKRPSASVAHLEKWQEKELASLMDVAARHKILFVPFDQGKLRFEKLLALVQKLHTYSYDTNLERAKGILRNRIASTTGGLTHFLVLDADKTLSSSDSGKIFWEVLDDIKGSNDPDARKGPLGTIFGGPLGYSHAAFYQAALIYETYATDAEFEQCCRLVSQRIQLHPEFVCLLRKVSEQKHVGAVVLTCGPQKIWKEVFQREGLANIEILGGGRILDDFVVSPEFKSQLVGYLQESHGLKVSAFGDSPIDINMLCKADMATVAVIIEPLRSKSMTEALKEVLTRNNQDASMSEGIEEKHLRANQVLFPADVKPRLNSRLLPVVDITETSMVMSLMGGHMTHPPCAMTNASDSTASKVLATAMRDAAFQGPRLREAHHRAGHYLALRHLSEILGLEQHSISHVLGRPTTGFRIHHEAETLIVALMRGGEPMAYGISEALPQAMFKHAQEPHDLQPQHLRGKINIILVDSVINTGKSILDFARGIRKTHATIRILVVAGVVQAQCLDPNSSFRKEMGGELGVAHLVTLRSSDTKFTGSGANDTGNRLFNTTHLL